jgi:two-component system, OmpR family, sensor kinase
VPIPLAFIDRDLRCTWSNERFRTFTGRRVAPRQAGVELAELLPASLATALSAEARRVLQIGHEVMVGLPSAIPGVFWRAHIVPLGPRGTDGVVCSLLEPVDERLRTLEDRLQEHASLLAVAAHELKNPLQALSLQLGSLGRAVGAGVEPTDLPGRLAMVRRQVERLERLATRLLDASQATRLRDLDDVDLAAVARETLAAHAEAARAAGCEVRFTSHGATVGRWDRTGLEQVVTNLIENAFRHAGGSRVDVDVRELPGAVRLTVRDHGPGVPLSAQDRVFRMFERLGEGDGSGLGLWIVREAVQAHGGLVRLETPKGGGAAFVVELPSAPLTR